MFACVFVYFPYTQTFKGLKILVAARTIQHDNDFCIRFQIGRIRF